MDIETMAEKYGLGWKIEYVRVYTYNDICYDSLERLLQEWKQQWRERKAASTNKSSKERTHLQMNENCDLLSFVEHSQRTLQV